MNVSVNYKGGMEFQGIDDKNFSITMDAENKNIGGQDKGPAPKKVFLMGLAGCTAMDVVFILRKMKVKLDDFKINVDTQLLEEHPKEFKKIHLTYVFTGKDLDERKVKKAVELSQTKYCSLSTMLKKVVPSFTYEYKIINS